MTCGSITGEETERLNATTATFSYRWMTDWESCVGLDSIMATLRGRACSSDNLEVQLVQQIALVRTDKPGLPVLKGTLQSPTSGAFSYNTGVIDISSDTAPAAYVRWGVAYRHTSGQAQASGDVGLEVAFTRCGEVVEAGSWQIDTSTTSVRYLPIGEWLPALLVNKVKLAAICTNLSGPIQWRLVMRTAATDKEEPGAWSNVTDINAPYGAGEINTGDLSVSLGANMWVQFGLVYNLSSAGTGQASISAALGVRRG
jgi:hypothetical protein